MGAHNAMRVYQLYGYLDDKPLRVLVYMALTARDGDAEPWFGLGHEILATMALSRKPDGAGLRAVRRAVTELHRAGAITMVKRPTNKGRHVHYRLWITHPSPDAQRPTTVDKPLVEPVDNPPSPDGERPTTEPGRRTVSDLSNGHRRTVSDLIVGRSPSYPIEEEEEEVSTGAKNTKGDLSEANCGKRARDPPMSLPA